MDNKTKANKRLKNELNSLSDTPVCNSTVTLDKEDDLFNWKIIMAGPVDSPYEGGIFQLAFKFPDNYPFKAPDVKFLTTMYHPNIKMDTGEICQDVFASGWTPTQKVQNILEQLVSMLQEPTTASPLEPDICAQYINDKDAFIAKAKEYTSKYAI